MKISQISLLFVIFSYNVCAQSKLSTTGLIKYQSTIYIVDTTTAGAVSEHLLLFNSSEATFFNAGSIKMINPDGSIQLFSATEKKIIAQQNQNFNAKIMSIKGNSIKISYLIKDTMMTIPWKLSKNTKKIQNIECFSAQAEYRGRVWNAWYAPSIPISSGPWKLYGLPGMILEVEDLKKLIKFECVAITVPPPTDIIMEIPKVTDTETMKNPITTKQYAILAEKDISNAEKMSYKKDKESEGHDIFSVRDIEIFEFEAKRKYMKRIQQKLSDIPKK